MRRPKVKLDNLIAFIAVAAKRDLEDAAEELGLSASGVRKQLDTIENTFGIRLFKKTGGVLALTDDAELFYGDAMKAVEQVLLAEEQVYARQAIRNHHLVIGHSTNLPPKLITSRGSVVLLRKDLDIDDRRPRRTVRRGCANLAETLAFCCPKGSALQVVGENRHYGRCSGLGTDSPVPFRAWIHAKCGHFA